MLRIYFIPVSDETEIKKATKEYVEIWVKEGERIVNTLSSFTGLEFVQEELAAIVYEGISRAGGYKRLMKLRSSFSRDMKLATLIHELSHRLLFGNGLVKTMDNIDIEQQKNLFLYDVWVELYGKEFADRIVKMESERNGVYDYKKAWDWAMSFSKEERAKKFKEVLDSSLQK